MPQTQEERDISILSALLSLRDAVAHGVLPVKTITDKYNEGKHEKAKITYQRVGRRLTAMGLARMLRTPKKRAQK